MESRIRTDAHEQFIATQSRASALAGCAWWPAGVDRGRTVRHQHAAGALLGLDHADSLAVDVEQVIGKAEAGGKRKFADRHATCGVQIRSGDITNVPTGLAQQLVDVLPRGLLGGRLCYFSLFWRLMLARWACEIQFGSGTSDERVALRRKAGSAQSEPAFP